MQNQSSNLQVTFKTQNENHTLIKCQISENVFVLKDQLCSFLSKRAFVDLGSITQIEEVSTPPVNFIGELEFPQLS